MENENLIIGCNAVKEALKSGRAIDYVIVSRGEKKGARAQIISECREKGIIVKEADEKKLDYLSNNGNHQGIVMFAAACEYAELDDIFKKAEESGKPPFIIICDSLEDPHNLGAIIRTAECAGVHGVIIPERRSVTLSGTVGKAAAGALEYMPVVRVKNLVSTMKMLKDKGVWIYGTDMNGSSLYQTDLSGSIAVVIGNEGRGLSRLVREECDGIVSIPMFGNINSLNASVAAGVVIYEIVKTRM
ncbi:MAG TPA: 23S rRNA (guanosine(2251)-2'-O)-methyltransferase RlmB [Clostridiales bacterium]|nr:23S rRNA (guanosine(2251)-2'-O)-methyltransferase RlmB [Clostridiales bacterium]